MSRSERDQPGGHPIQNPRLMDCHCCERVTARDRIGTRSADQQRTISEQLSTGDNSESRPSQHVYIAGRCIRCHTDWIDADLPGLSSCPGKEDDQPIVYSTATGEEPESSHPAITADHAY